jgi:hypothetical protein
MATLQCCGEPNVLAINIIEVERNVYGWNELRRPSPLSSAGAIEYTGIKVCRVVVSTGKALKIAKE